MNLRHWSTARRLPQRAVTQTDVIYVNRCKRSSDMSIESRGENNDRVLLTQTFPIIPLHTLSIKERLRSQENNLSAFVREPDDFYHFRSCIF